MMYRIIAFSLLLGTGTIGYTDDQLEPKTSSQDKPRTAVLQSKASDAVQLLAERKRCNIVFDRSGESISGAVHCDTFEVLPGISILVDDDLEIHAKRSIKISGDLRIANGNLEQERRDAPSMILRAGEVIEVDGTIVGGDGANIPQGVPVLIDALERGAPEMLRGGRGSTILFRAPSVWIDGAVHGGGGGDSGLSTDGGSGGDVVVSGNYFSNTGPEDPDVGIFGGRGGNAGRGVSEWEFAGVTRLTGWTVAHSSGEPASALAALRLGADGGNGGHAIGGGELGDELFNGASGTHKGTPPPLVEGNPGSDASAEVGPGEDGVEGGDAGDAQGSGGNQANPASHGTMTRPDGENGDTGCYGGQAKGGEGGDGGDGGDNCPGKGGDGGKGGEGGKGTGGKGGKGGKGGNAYFDATTMSYTGNGGDGGVGGVGGSGIGGNSGRGGNGGDGMDATKVGKKGGNKDAGKGVKGASGDGGDPGDGINPGDPGGINPNVGGEADGVKQFEGLDGNVC